MAQPIEGRARRDRPIRLSLKDEAAAHLRDQILAGRLRPGHRIDQDQIAGELGISRLPVREAIITLAAEGLVDAVPRRGAFVAQLAPEDLQDHYLIFGVLSGLAAERAATALTDLQLDQLEELIRQMDASSDHDEQEALNFELHRMINRAGASRRLLAVLSLLSKNLPTRFYEFTEGYADRASRDHHEILAALRSRDPRRAAEAAAAHFRNAGEHAVQLLREAGYWDNR